MRGLKTTSPSHLCFLSIWKCALFLPRGSRSRAFIFSEPLVSFRSFPSNSLGPWNCYEPFWWWTKASGDCTVCNFLKREFQFLMVAVRFFFCSSHLKNIFFSFCFFFPTSSLSSFLGICEVLCRPHSERTGPFSTWEEKRGGHSFFCSLTADVCK